MVYINKGTLDTIKINTPYERDVSDVGYINDDSIFVLLNPVKHYGFHDSILFLMNRKGEIKKYYSFDNAPVITWSNYLNKNADSTCVIMDNRYEPFNYYKGKIFLHLQNNGVYLGDEAYKNFPVIGYMDVKENKFHTLNIKIPDIEYGKEFYPFEFNFFNSVVTDDGKLIISFPHTPKLVVYDINKDTTSIVEMKSKIFDKIFPFNSTSEVSKDWMFPFPMYHSIYYDKYRKYYYRMLLLPKEYHDPPMFLMIVADSNFNYIGEGFTPDSISFVVNFNKDYFFKIRLKGNNRLNIHYYQMYFEDGTNQDFIKKLKKIREKPKTYKNIKIENYFYELTGQKNKNYTATIFFFDNSCPSIRDFIIKHYKANHVKYEEYGTYLIFVTQNKQKVETFLKANDLDPKEHKNILIDSNYLFIKYNDNSFDYYPRVIKVRKGKLIDNKLFTTQEGISEDWQDYLIEATEERMK